MFQTGRWEEEEEIHEPVQKAPRLGGGAAIAPPPSLQEPQESVPVFPPKPQAAPLSGSSVAAKIMAKYGFKEGQGLGKQEQGMSMALQVEKTSKRGGRIIHEKEILPQPAPIENNENEPSITEIMKSPSKVPNNYVINKNQNSFVFANRLFCCGIWWVLVKWMMI